MSNAAWRSRIANLVAAAVPPLGRLRNDRDRAAAERDRLGVELDAVRSASQLESGSATAPALYPPGHFYSPIPDLESVRRDEERIFRCPDTLPGIDVNSDGQLELLHSMSARWRDWPYYDEIATGLRYRPDNDYFGHVDGLALFAMLGALEPKRYLEVGSGWSSALVLDTRERLLERDVECTFIEPYADRLHSLLTAEDSNSVRVLEHPVQDVDPSVFGELDAGDILFVDSSHVSKIGSDVNHLFFDLLPRVRTGVWLHVHDIGYPFEYPRAWIDEGRAWNEAYVLRALLTENPRWKIVFWSDYLKQKHRRELERSLPEDARLDGVSLWMVRQ
jgi:hypothetical protein